MVDGRIDDDCQCRQRGEQHKQQQANAQCHCPFTATPCFVPVFVWIFLVLGHRQLPHALKRAQIVRLWSINGPPDEILNRP
jgi:hypothetical protein